MATRSAAVRTSASAKSAQGLGTRPHDFERFASMDPVSQGRTIRDGMDAIIAERVAKELLQVPLQTLLAGLGLPSSTILRKISRKERLSGSESDRIARVLYIHEQAADVFEDEALAAQWMRRPNATLGGMTPLEVLDTQPGYDRVRDILSRIAFGVAA
ncbi:antitoxin Xre/MbcA/ParS toxin-binding domain-containing protein [Herbaspirillum sp. NPDC087042]|uniref:type II RES/Xre toxin-antitoxin system antitoxin n=1 Tax=Herbaspirillum sp. NPDC087042 TaxID=3364004 RepID=UPI00381934E6